MRPITQTAKKDEPKNFGVHLTRNLRTVHGNKNTDEILDIPDETLEFRDDI